MAQANSGIPLGQWSGSDAVEALHRTIREFNEATSRQTRTLITLTWVIAGLSVVMVLGLCLQIYIAVLRLPR